MIAVIDHAIDVAAVAAAVRHPGAGAVLVFEGVARDNAEGREVLSLAYEAWPEVAVREMERIAAEALARWPGSRVAMVHRTGTVAVGEPSIVIAVSGPHRADTYETSRYCIDTLKQRVPIWKKELYRDGSSWIANTPAGNEPSDHEPGAGGGRP
jgi:molybdopterin synthase catalytic subunit